MSSQRARQAGLPWGVPALSQGPLLPCSLCVAAAVRTVAPSQGCVGWRHFGSLISLGFKTSPGRSIDMAWDRIKGPGRRLPVVCEMPALPLRLQAPGDCVCGCVLEPLGKSLNPLVLIREGPVGQAAPGCSSERTQKVAWAPALQ